MKKFLFILGLLICSKAHAFEQVAFPGTATNLSGGALQTAFNNPDNIKVEDGVVASTSCPGVGTVLIKASNFGFNISQGQTITGIKVRIKKNENTDVLDRSVVLFDINGSSVGVTDHASMASWPTPLAYVTYGSSSDLWGRSWNVADINSSNFAVGIAANRNAGGTQIAEIDAIEVTIYSTQPTTIYSGTINGATLR